MTNTTRALPAASAGADAIAALAPELLRYARSFTDDEHVAADAVQEAIARMLEARHRLHVTTLPAYGLVTTRHLLASRRRTIDLESRHRPRLQDPGTPADPAEALMAAEEYAAMRRALAALTPEQRHLVVDHHLDDDTRDRVTGAVAARLARARAALRLEYVLALRRVELPTGRCRPVLLSVSARDKRRQAALRAGEHLAVCATCGDLAAPLLTRSRALAAVTAPLVAGWAWLRSGVGAHPVTAATVGVVGAGAVATGIVLSSGSPTPAAAPRTPPVACPVMGKPGSTVRLHDARVVAVPANEGFVVSACQGTLVWVSLVGHGESPVTIGRHMHVDLVGRLERDGVDYRSVAHLSAAQSSRLDPADVHIRVGQQRVHITRS